MYHLPVIQENFQPISNGSSHFNSTYKQKEPAFYVAGSFYIKKVKNVTSEPFLFFCRLHVQ